MVLLIPFFIILGLLIGIFAYATAKLIQYRNHPYTKMNWAIRFAFLPTPIKKIKTHQFLSGYDFLFQKFIWLKFYWNKKVELSNNLNSPFFEKVNTVEDPLYIENFIVSAKRLKNRRNEPIATIKPAGIRPLPKNAHDATIIDFFSKKKISL